MDAMDADEFIVTLDQLMERECGRPLCEKLAMPQEQCHLWLRNLYAKRLSLHDAQEAIRMVIAQQGQQDGCDLDDLLAYV